MPKVFISHQFKKKGEAKALRSNLNRRFIKVWLDESDLGIGRPLISEIYRAIDEHPVFIALVSKEYLNSDYCRMEFNYAVEQKIKRPVEIIPVTLDDRSDLLKAAKEKGWLEMARALESDLSVLYNEYDPEITFGKIAKGVTGTAPIWFEPIRIETVDGLRIQIIEVQQVEKVPVELFSDWDYDLEAFMATKPNEDRPPIEFGMPVGFYNSRINWVTANLVIPFKNRRTVFIYNNPVGYICVYPLESEYKGKILKL